MLSGADSGPNFLLDWHESEDARRHWYAGMGSLVAHVAIVALVFVLGSLSGPAQRPATEIIPDLHQAVHLTLPADLTQKAPNKGKVAKEINVEDLKPRPPSEERLPPAPAVRVFQPPKPGTPGPLQQSAAPRIAEPPKIPQQQITAQNTPPLPPALAGTPKAPPPPQIQPVEQPKLAFQTPGQEGPSEHKGQGKVQPPKTDVQSIVREMARGGGGAGGNITVGNLDQPPDLPPSIHLPPSPARTGSSMQLRSDPMGVDFRPYLYQILALVRRNWSAVIPESVHMGNRGVTEIVFTIDRNGQVPKLVIDTPSGSQSLDRAAVAGISASVPFPPLPRDFKGQQIILRFSFKYNVN
jgi:TonB family protein